MDLLMAALIGAGTGVWIGWRARSSQVHHLEVEAREALRQWHAAETELETQAYDTGPYVEAMQKGYSIWGSGHHAEGCDGQHDYWNMGCLDHMGSALATVELSDGTTQTYLRRHP